MALGASYIDKNDAIENITNNAISNSATKLIPENSLLFGIRVGIGKCSINRVPMCTNQDIVGIMNLQENGFNPLYIKKVLESYSLYFNEQKRGATIQGITTELLKESRIPQAPLDLQNQFADFVKQADKSKFVAQRATKTISSKSMIGLTKYTRGGNDYVL